MSGYAFLTRSNQNIDPPWAMSPTIGASRGRFFFGESVQCPENVDRFVAFLGTLVEQPRERWSLTCDSCKKFIFAVVYDIKAAVFLFFCFGGILGSASGAEFPVSLSNHVGYTARLLYSSTGHSQESFTHLKTG